MKLSLYGIVVIFALLIILIVFNPNLSCFGRKLKSPFYPLLRKKKRRQKKNQPADYGFDLGGTGKKRTQQALSKKSGPERISNKKVSKPTEDYGFDLGGTNKKEQG